MRRILLSLIIITMFLPIASAESITTVESVPNSITVNPNETFTIDIMVDPSDVIDTVAIDLVSWDSSLLQCLDLNKGGLFEESTVWIDGDINSGNITNICWGSHASTDVTGKYITLTFKALKEGACNIVLDEVGIAHAGEPFDKDVTNCQVTIGAGGSPDPIAPINEETGNGEAFEFELPEIPVFFVLGVIIIIAFVVIIMMVKKVKNPKDPSFPNK